MSARLRALIALPALLLSLLATVVATDAVIAPTADAAGHHGHHPRIHHARKIALNQIGDPYRWGAAGPNAFDCSGLVYFSFRHAGLSVPRTSAEQAQRARHIKRRNLRPGDLMFFYGGGGVYHVAIFLRRHHGHVVMLHSPHTGSHVQRARPWTNSWFAGTLRRR